MNGRNLVEVALKIWGLVLLLGGLVATPSEALMATAEVGSAVQGAFVRATQVASMLNLLVSATLGLCLILWGGHLAERAIPETPALRIGVDGAQLQGLAFRFLGVVTLIGGLQDLGAVTYVLMAKPKWAEIGTFEYLWGRQAEAMVRALVQIAAGVVLILGTSVIARAWRRLRGGVDDAG